MKQLFIAFIIIMFTLQVQGQNKADSTTTETTQEAPKNLSPAQQKALEAKQKRDSDAAKRKEEAEKRKQESLQKRQQGLEQRKAAADQRKTGATTKKAGTGKEASPTDSANAATVAPAKDKKSGKKEAAPKPSPEELKQKAAEERQRVAEKRKEDAEAKKKEAAEKKEAAAQLKASGGTPAKKGSTAGGATAAPKKTAEEKAKERKEAEALKPRPGSKNPKGKNGKDEAPAPVQESQIAKLYFTLPLEALPQVAKYLEEHPDVKESIDNDKVKDPYSGSMHDTRKGLINKEDGQRNYLQLGQMEKYTRLQLFNTKDLKALIAIQTDECNPDCKNTFKLYKQNNDGWEDVTASALPALDKKYMLGKIKSAYKKQYMDNSVYEAKGYETDENFFQSAIVYTINPEANKIIVRDQIIDLPLYEITWDPIKSKFNITKL